MAKKTALLGMLVALAFVLSYIETLIPINLGIPGAKLGLANLVVMVALYTLGTKEAFALSMVRILLTGLTFSSMAAMLYSFSGGLLYAGGKFPFFVFGAAFGGKNDVFRRLYGQKTYGFRIARASAKSSLGVAAALRMCVAVSR